MPTYMYAQGKYHLLAGNKIVKDGDLLQIKNQDTIIADGKQYTLGIGKNTVTPDTPDIPAQLPQPQLTTLNTDIVQPSSGNIYYITPGGTGDGSSWANAANTAMVFSLIQRIPEGSSIYFLHGQYQLSRPIVLSKSINLYGGFPYEDAPFNLRDTFNSPSTFTAQYQGAFVDIATQTFNGVIDGFQLVNYKYTSVQSYSANYRNMLIRNSQISITGNIYNSYIYDSSIQATSMQKIIYNGSNKSIKLTGDLKTSTLYMGNGELQVNNITSPSQVYIYQANIKKVSDITNAVIEGDIASCFSTTNTVIKGNIGGAANITQSTIEGDIASCFSTTNTVIKGNIASSTIDSSVISGQFISTINSSNSLYTYTSTGIFDGWQNDDFHRRTYYIKKGYLYYHDGTQVGIQKGWTDISGFSYFESSTYYYAYGICNGELYQLYQTTATKIETGGNGWTSISGYSFSSSDSSTRYHAYGICNGELYTLQETTATKIETGDSGWTAISGYSSSSTYYAYGICNGELYRLNKTTATKIKTGGSGWTAISGHSSGTNAYAYGICNGELYALQNTTATKISTGGSGWTAISGYSLSSVYAYGICNRALYALQITTATKISTGGSGWTAISGYSGSSGVLDYYAYGICNGGLYELDGTTATKISTGGSGWTYISGHSGSVAAYDYCAYGICNDELYALQETTATCIGTYIFTPRITQMWQHDDSIRCSYYIKRGYLYYQDGTQVGTQKGWTAISGYSSSSTLYYAYGICNGELYQLSGTTATKISTGGSGWTNISGYSYSSDSYTYYAYGICNGELYALKGTTATKISTGGSGWTAISGYSYSSVYCTYGICNGELYSLEGTTATKISIGGSGWTNISGYSSSYAYGICNGELYALKGTTATKISIGGSGWTAISGYSSHVFTHYAYGICNGELYRLYETTATKISTGGSGWTAISGYSSNSNYYAYGICNGELYQLSGTTATKISTGGSGWTAIRGYSYSIYSYAYGICNGELYSLEGTTATCIGVYMLIVGILNDTSSKFLNSKHVVDYATNSLFVNCQNSVNQASFCTFANSIGSVQSGSYNVFWNCTGTIPAANNAQSQYNQDNLITLDYNNFTTQFKNTGFSSGTQQGRGLQVVRLPPNYKDDPEGYQEWIDQFGDFKPLSTSLLKGRAPLDSTVPTDIDGTTRLDPTTPGAYETTSTT